MTQTSSKITKTVAQSFFNVFTGGKNEQGYHNKETIGTVVAAGSVLGGVEVKYDFAQINLATVEKLKAEGKIKGNFLQFQIQANPKAQEQLAALQAEVARLKAENTQLKATTTQTDDIPF